MSEGEGLRALELRQRAVLALGMAPAAGLAGLLQDVIAAGCPLEDKYLEVNVTSILWENMAAMPSDGLVNIGRALNILEKYGRNLLAANKPKFWRA
ncbi:E3 ubiquitin-protein ligase RNF31-like [Cetorhinus maximus]